MSQRCTDRSQRQRNSSSPQTRFSVVFGVSRDPTSTMDTKQRLQKQITAEAAARKLREIERLKAAAQAMGLETLGLEKQSDGKLAGNTFNEILTNHKAYLVWLMDHQAENPKYTQLLEFARLKEEEKKGHQVDSGALRLSTKLDSLGHGPSKSGAASSGPSEDEWSRILESQGNQDIIVNNLMDQLAETRRELKVQKEMIEHLDRRLRQLEGANMEMS